MTHHELRRTEPWMINRIVRETLDGFQAGFIDERGRACWDPRCFMTECEAIRHSDTAEKCYGRGAIVDPDHADFVSDCGQVDELLVDDYCCEYGEPEAEVLSDIGDLFGREAAVQAAMGFGDPFVGGWRAKFACHGMIFWTPANHRTKLGAQVNAIARWFVLGEMFDARRPERVSALRYGGDDGGPLLRVEVTRGPEVRVYRVPHDYRPMIDAVWGKYRER